MFALDAFVLIILVKATIARAGVSGSTSGLGGQCAGIFSNKNFRGTRLLITSDIGWTYKGNFKFIPKSVKVTPNCSLTMFDGVGTIQTLREDMNNFTWISKNSVHSTCCHCGNCEQRGPLGLQCAQIFQYENCNACGKPIDLANGQEIRDFHLIRNKIGSVSVRNECRLDVYYEVKTSAWKVLVKATLQSGNNFVEVYEPFKEEASVRLEKANCKCNVSSLLDEHEETISLESHFNKKTKDAVFTGRRRFAVDNLDSKEYSSTSSSAEFLYKDPDQHDEDQWFYRR